MSTTYDAVIIGAGPAGLASAIQLQSAGWKVAIVEKNDFPRDKVCGGFIGPENKSIFQEWGILDELMQQGALPVRNICLGSTQGSFVRAPIFYHGKKEYALAVSRRLLDWTMMKKAFSLGADLYKESVVTANVKKEGVNELTLNKRLERSTATLQARHIIHAAGNNLNKQGSVHPPLFGVAANFKDVLDMDENVYLYFMDQAHLGINRFENGVTNVCYVADQKLFQELDGDMQNIYLKMKEENPRLGKQLKSSRQVTHWKVTSIVKPSGFQFSHDGMFCVGDSVGVINPVMGGGNSMAINSAVLLTELMAQFSPGDLPEQVIARKYERLWRKLYAARYQMSWLLGDAAHNRHLADAGIRLFKFSNILLNKIFEHGHSVKPLNPSLIRTEENEREFNKNNRY